LEGPAVKELLIVEDDDELRLLIDESLKTSYEVVKASTGQEGMKLYESEHPDMVILDLNLPDADGLDLCREIREKDKLIPIIIMSSRKDEVDRVLGLEFGADDYITKPFSVRELKSRVNAFFRKLHALEVAYEENIPAVKSHVSGRCTLKFNDEYHELHINGINAHLSRTEYQLLRLLAGSPGRVFSREEIIQAIWGEEWTGTQTIVSQNFKRMRQKIEPDPKKPEYVQTIHGVGYRLDPDCNVVIK